MGKRRALLKQELYSKHMESTVSELKQLLGVNDQNQSGAKSDLAWRCAYMELLGAVQRCKAENRRCEGKLKVNVDPEDNGDPEKVTYTCPGWFDDETDKFKFHGKKYSATELSFAKMKQLNTSAKESSLEHRKKKRKQLVAESTNISTDKKKNDNLSPKRKKHKKSINDVEGSASFKTKRRKKKNPCPYGAECYRKNPKHFAEYSHPSD